MWKPSATYMVVFHMPITIAKASAELALNPNMVPAGDTINSNSREA